MRCNRNDGKTVKPPLVKAVGGSDGGVILLGSRETDKMYKLSFVAFAVMLQYLGLQWTIAAIGKDLASSWFSRSEVKRFCCMSAIHEGRDCYFRCAHVASDKKAEQK